MGDRNYKLKSRYGLTEKVYQDLLTGQGYSCKICGTKHTEEKKLQVDHHQVGSRDYIAGLLCGNCNTMIAHAKHRVDLLKKAVVYLEGR